MAIYKCVNEIQCEMNCLIAKKDEGYQQSTIEGVCPFGFEPINIMWKQKFDIKIKVTESY